MSPLDVLIETIWKLLIIFLVTVSILGVLDLILVILALLSGGVK